MARLIEVEDVQAIASPLTLRIGDLVMVKASGGFVSMGEAVMERLGPFVAGILQNDRPILSPMGSPDTVMFLAREVGSATIEVAIGDPYFNSQLVQIAIRVEP